MVLDGGCWVVLDDEGVCIMYILRTYVYTFHVYNIMYVVCALE